MAGKIIKVSFFNGAVMANGSDANLEKFRHYDYFLLGSGQDAKVGDYAVVHANDALVITKVVDIAKTSTKAKKFALAIFNLDEHQNAVKRQAERAEILAAIEERMAEATFMEKVSRLAQGDAKLDALLGQLKGIDEAE